MIETLTTEFETLGLTTDQVTAFNALTSTHSSLRTAYARFKRNLVTDLWQTQQLVPELLRAHPALYVGSGLDIFLPLCLGCRSLYLLDMCFEDIENVLAIEQLIKSTFHVAPKVGLDGSLRFQFDFGEGMEEVTVWTTFGSYPLEELTEESLARYGPQDRMTKVHNRIGMDGWRNAPQWSDLVPLSLLLLFNAYDTRLDNSLSTMESVVPGGWLFSTSSLEGISDYSVFDEQREIILEGKPIEYSWLQEKYALNSSFDVLRLNHFAEVEYTFLQKKR